jgi:YebC/PmpR family DNA-binding regulatory protein
MAGHSHWAGIKHKKALIDNKRGKLWSKLAKAIIVAAKHGGGDPNANLKLRYAVDAAKAVSMPKENIERAIKKGTGEGADAASFDEILYEGYGAGGVAVLCEVLTDNRNRTAGEVRKIFEISDGKLGATGCVAYLFERKGLLVIGGDQTNEDALMEIALEAGADDVRSTGGKFEVTCDPSAFQTLCDALESRQIAVEVKEITRVPCTTVDLDADTARKVLRMMELLDDHDDVQSVSANFNLPDEALAELARN